jgi:hypothetical protein
MNRVAAVAIGIGLTWAVPAALAAQPAPPSQAAPAVRSGPALTSEREAALRARVTKWYDARRMRDQRAMYDLLDPEYRAKTDFATYATNTGIRLRFTLHAFDVESVQPGEAPDTAVVRVKLTLDLGRFGSSPVVSTDPWVWRDGQWWAVFKPFEPPFRTPGGA